MTRVVRWTVVSVLCLASFAWAQDGGFADVTAEDVSSPALPPPPSLPPPPPPIEAAPPPAVTPAPVALPTLPPREVVSDRSIGIHVGVNLGLFAFDVQQQRFYAFAAANAGVPLVSNGSVGAFAIGIGYSAPISRPDESMWFMDFFGEALPGWFQSGSFSQSLVVGVGAGLGFRYLHRSGFTMGFKLPVFGASFSSATNYTAAASVGYFFLFNAIALPVISFGYRF